MPRECLPDHLKDERHGDWWWPLSLVPRAWNAYCGLGPVWQIGKGYQSRPVPEPGFRSAHIWDKDGSYRPYFARTFKNGFHYRRGYRFDDVDRYYNLIRLFSAGFEYRDGKPI
jgi:hypothetical protein